MTRCLCYHKIENHKCKCKCKECDIINKCKICLKNKGKIIICNIWLCKNCDEKIEKRKDFELIPVSENLIKKRGLK